MPQDYRLAAAAYDHPAACYDREYLFQFSELDPRHPQPGGGAGRRSLHQSPTGCMTSTTEPYHPAYFMINGRSFPDDTDPNYTPQYPHQPYNGNPHMHPGELVLLRIIGQGRMQHPFHEHANHVRVLARDGNLLLQRATATCPVRCCSPPRTTPGQAMDGHLPVDGQGPELGRLRSRHGNASTWPTSTMTIRPLRAGRERLLHDRQRRTGRRANYYEWCGDHGKPLESKPFGNVGDGGPVTLPDPNIVANGAWYGGSPYLGPEATVRAVGATPIPPSGTVANDPGARGGLRVHVALA